ncbi:MAG: hypothetical protein WBP58_15500 [Chitinophagaceae bacterium]
MAIICFIVPALKHIGIFVAVGGIILVVVGAVSGRGKGLKEVGEEMLHCHETGLSIAGKEYPYDSIKALHFYFHSFYSQSSFGYFYENAGMIQYGMANRVSFVADGEKIEVLFFLGNILQSDMFFAYLQELKARGIRYTFSQRDYRR